MDGKIGDVQDVAAKKVKGGILGNSGQHKLNCVGKGGARGGTRLLLQQLLPVQAHGRKGPGPSFLAWHTMPGAWMLASRVV